MRDLIERKDGVVTFSLCVWGTTVLGSPIILTIVELLKVWCFHVGHSNYANVSEEIGESLIIIIILTIISLIISTPIYLLYICVNFIGVYFYENIQLFRLWSSFCGFILVYAFNYFLTRENGGSLSLLFWIYTFVGFSSVFYYAKELYTELLIKN
jgi:hypothetical protein